jgi:hypothetical protein
MTKLKINKTNSLTYVLIILLLLLSLNDNTVSCMDSIPNKITQDINYLNSLQPDFINTSIRQHLRSLDNDPLYNQAIKYYEECIFIKKEFPSFTKSEIHKKLLDTKRVIILEKIRYVPSHLYLDTFRSVLHMDLLANCVKNFCSDI